MSGTGDQIGDVVPYPPAAKVLIGVSTFLIAIGVVWTVRDGIMLGTWEQRGQAGDFLGGHIAAFAGLSSTALLIAALIVQSAELRSQSRELARSRLAFEAQARQFEQQLLLAKATADEERRVRTMTTLARELHDTSFTHDNKVLTLHEFRREVGWKVIADPGRRDRLWRSTLVQANVMASYCDAVAVCLDRVGLLALAGAIDIRLVLADAASRIVVDWIIASRRVSHIRKQFPHEVETGVPYHRRHAEWLACVASLYLIEHAADPDILDVLKLMGQPSEVLLRAQAIARSVRDVKGLESQRILHELERRLRPETVPPNT